MVSKRMPPPDKRTGHRMGFIERASPRGTVREGAGKSVFVDEAAEPFVVVIGSGSEVVRKILREGGKASEFIRNVQSAKPVNQEQIDTAFTEIEKILVGEVESQTNEILSQLRYLYAHNLAQVVDQAKEELFEQHKRIVLDRMLSRFQTREEAEDWFDHVPLPGFGDKTPADLVRDGRTIWVIDTIDAIEAGVYA